MNRLNTSCTFLVIWFIFLNLSGSAQVQNLPSGKVPDKVNIVFDQWFLPKSLRVDYLLGGDSATETVFFQQMKQEPNYGGPLQNLIDPFDYGSYRYLAFDSASGKLIFARGFSTLFQEWRGTPEARHMKRAFMMTAIMPFPLKTILLKVEKRSYQTNEFEELFSRFINPADYFIVRENVPLVNVTKIRESGSASNHVDIAFIAEGYTLTEMEKFRTDAKRMADYFLSKKPYSDFNDNFNFYAIESPSDESGVTNPGKGSYVNTNMHSSFYTFDMDRYLTTSDTKSIYDQASVVPYDLIFILVNSKQYGGGGFYNHYGQSTVDHRLSEIVALHEFGHEFAGLADEYYTSEVTYSDFYNLKLEPWEPNITTNVNFEAKWKSLISAGVPIPTPRTEEYKRITGMFEGGGYVAKGIFSPVMDCRMKSNEAPDFCPVCQEAIRKMILFYSEK